METDARYLPPGWARPQIDDILEPQEDGQTLHQGWSPRCGKVASQAEEVWGVLKTTAIQPGSFHPEHNKQLPKTLKPRPRIEVRAGDILITCAGPRARCGVACLVKRTRQRLMMSGKMYRFRVPPTSMEARFVENYLQTAAAQDAIDQMKTGGSDSGLNLTHDRFRLLEIALAPTNEQRRIVAKIEELFSQLDAGVEELKKAKVQLKRYRQSVLAAAFEGKLTEEWRKAHKGKVESVSDLPDLPEGWTRVRVGELAERIQYGTSDKACEDSRGVPVVRMGNLRDGALSFENLKYMPRGWSCVGEFLLSPGDVLFNRTNSAELVGKTAVYKEGSPQAVFASYLIRLQLHSEAYLPALLSAYINSHFGRTYIAQVVSQQVGQANVSGSKLAAMPVPVPPQAEQCEIAAEMDLRLSVAGAEEKAIEAALRQAARLRQSILKRAFEGRLVPQDPSDEPAERLLERIRAEKAKRAAGQPRGRGRRTATVGK